MDVDVIHCYEDAEADRETINTITDNCYLPANEIILSQVNEYHGKFKLSYSISGTLLEQLQQYRTDVIDSFKALTARGCVDILGETYYRSLSWLHSRKEFQRRFLNIPMLLKTFSILNQLFSEIQNLFTTIILLCLLPVLVLKEFYARV